jgi:hypothetical protein
VTEHKHFIHLFIFHNKQEPSLLLNQVFRGIYNNVVQCIYSSFAVPVSTSDTQQGKLSTSLTFKLSPWFVFLQFSSFWVITRRLVLKFKPTFRDHYRNRLWSRTVGLNFKTRRRVINQKEQNCKNSTIVKFQLLIAAM